MCNQLDSIVQAVVVFSRRLDLFYLFRYVVVTSEDTIVTKIVAFKYALLKHQIPVVVIIINVTEGTLQTQPASG